MKFTFSVTGRATAAAAVLLVVIAIAPPRATARSVATHFKTCSWFAYNRNITDAGYCTLNDDFVAFNPEKPVSWISKQLRVVYGRNYRCDLLTSESACKAANSKLNCYWSANDRRCLGQEVTQWKWFTRHPYLSEAPQWLKWTCPGTMSATYKRCSALASYAQADMGPCKAAKGCAVSSDGKTCTSSLLANMTDQDRSAWFSKYMRLDPSVAGTCGSVCYLRAAFACPVYNIIVDDKEREAKCAANKWCFWNPDNCAANLYGSDAWGKAVTVARDACNQLRNSSACVAGGPTFNAAQDVQVDLPLADLQPSKGTGKCDI